MASTNGIRIAIDRGGTFTDAWAQIPGQTEDVVLKILSDSPDEYEDAPTECIRRILELAAGEPIPRGQPLDLTPVETVRMGTTVATNALLERKGSPVAFLVTKGFRDALKIGNQARPNIFDMSVQRLGKLYDTVVEVDERVTIETFSEDPYPKDIDVESDPALRPGLSGEPVRILKTPDYAVVKEDLLRLWSDGYRSLAIGLLHSYTFQDHELAIAQMARELGFRVSASSEIQTMAKLIPRSQSAVADAFLSPVTDAYLQSFRKGFSDELSGASANKLLLNQSDGGLTSFANFSGLRGILSGPAGGVVGLSRTCYSPKTRTPVLGFDSKLALLLSTSFIPELIVCSGRDKYRRREICRLSRAHLRKYTGGGHHPNSAARHQYCGSGRRLNAFLVERHAQGRAAECRSKPWPGLLRERRPLDYNGREFVPGKDHSRRVPPASRPRRRDSKI